MLFIVFKLYNINLKISFTIKLSIFYFRNFLKGFFKIIIMLFLRNFFNSYLFIMEQVDERIVESLTLEMKLINRYLDKHKFYSHNNITFKYDLKQGEDLQDLG